jgi:hypothetical protein
MLMNAGACWSSPRIRTTIDMLRSHGGDRRSRGGRAVNFLAAAEPSKYR